MRTHATDTQFPDRKPDTTKWRVRIPAKGQVVADNHVILNESDKAVTVVILSPKTERF